MVEINYRIPVAQNYAEALGRAVYSFCYLEWGVIWIIECLSQGFLADATGKTAGQIADRFLNEVKQPHGLDTSLEARLHGFAQSFQILVRSRNALVHGNPYTADDGEQRLGYYGKAGRIEWPLSDIVDVTLEFEAAATEASDLLHNHLLHNP